FISRTFSQRCATRVPANETCLQFPLDTFFQTPVSREVEKRRIFLRTARRTRNPAQYLLAIQQMVENNYPIPPSLADVPQKSEVCHTASILHFSSTTLRSRPFEPELTWPMRKWSRRTTLDRGEHDPKKDPCACLDQPKVKIKDDASFLTCSPAATGA
ncbi:hypothetical protein EDB83DRAFT_2233546, partial [Lactarius deliciosus]